jgi:hypothetical protein
VTDGRCIGAEELAVLLGVDEEGLRDIARGAGLPYDFSAAYGQMWINRDDFPSWQCAVARWRDGD